MAITGIYNISTAYIPAFIEIPTAFAAIHNADAMSKNPIPDLQKAISHLSKPVTLPLSPSDLDAINAYLRELQPDEILRWGVEYLPGLHQTTAFGLTGLVAIDMLAGIAKEASKNTDSGNITANSENTAPSTPPLIFLDTLYHFAETYALVEDVKARYGVPVHVYKPEGCESVEAFEGKYGERLWERDEGLYDFLVKVCDPL